MATTDPLIGVTIYDNNDPALGGQQLGVVASGIRSFTIPRFTSTSTRDSQFATWVAAGGVIKDGMTCWCDTPGSYYDRQSGVWVPRAKTEYGTLAIDGTTVPTTARLVRVRQSKVITVSNTSGGISVPFGFSFTKLMAVALWPGDSAGNLGFIVPITANHTLSTGNGQAFQPGGAVVPNGTVIRVEVDAVGYI